MNSFKILDEDLVTTEKQDVLETCLYYFLVERDIKETGDSYRLFLKAPWEYPLEINIDTILIQQVDSIEKKSSQFNIHGDISFVSVFQITDHFNRSRL